MNSSIRYIPHGDLDPNTDLSEARNVLINALRKGVARVHRHPSSRPSSYIGAGGHLMLSWKLSDTLPELKAELITVDISTFELGRAASGSKASFLETRVGTATLVLVQHLRTPSDTTAKKVNDATLVIKGAIQLAVDREVDDEGCEVLYGRAGLLYCLLYQRTHLAVVRDSSDDDVPKATLTRLASDRNVKVLVDDIIARGRWGAKAYAREFLNEEQQLLPALMWTWHGKRYLGAAHGVTGILQMLLCVPESTLSPHWDAILNTIEWLLSIQQPSGNWPHKPSKHMQFTDHDELIQWCHGAPGMLILLSTLLRRFESSSSRLQLPSSVVTSARTALARGGELVYARGLLRKGVGLCHGVAGSVYALLAVGSVLDPPVSSNSSGIGEWRRCAVHLALLACEYENMTQRGEMDTPDRPYSLYEGVAGMCAAWVDVVCGLSGRRWAGGMPGYSDVMVL